MPLGRLLKLFGLPVSTTRPKDPETGERCQALTLDDSGYPNVARVLSASSNSRNRAVPPAHPDIKLDKVVCNFSQILERFGWRPSYTVSYLFASFCQRIRMITLPTFRPGTSLARRGREHDRCV